MHLKCRTKTKRQIKHNANGCNDLRNLPTFYMTLKPILFDENAWASTIITFHQIWLTQYCNNLRMLRYMTWFRIESVPAVDDDAHHTRKINESDKEMNEITWNRKIFVRKGRKTWRLRSQSSDENFWNAEGCMKSLFRTRTGLKTSENSTNRDYNKSHGKITLLVISFVNWRNFLNEMYL